MQRNKRHRPAGFAQLTLIEHSLCPLDTAVSLCPGLTHKTRFAYSKDGKRRVGNVELHLPLGLSASDEFYLWGLLALTLRQPENDSHFAASPHYCLRQLGVVDSKTGRGGRNYELFRASLKRLAAATYQSDSFYDPMRQEHCQVSFGFLSYRLPQDPLSDRLWHFHWDPLFFELCGAGGGRLSFDLELYRRLDPASRRLFLLLHKVFYRRRESPVFGVRQLAVDVLGFAAGLSNGELNRKLRRVIHRLAESDVICLDNKSKVISESVGRFTVQFHRGSYFRGLSKSANRLTTDNSSLTDALVSLGFETRDAGRIRARYEASLLREWIDITIAAAAAGRIRKSKQAFLVDNLKHAKNGTRSIPDWWAEVRKAEERIRETDNWTRIRNQLGHTKPAATTSPTALSRIGDLLSS